MGSRGIGDDSGQMPSPRKERRVSQLISLIAEDRRANRVEARSRRVLLYFRVCQFILEKFADGLVVRHSVEWFYARRVTWRFGVELPLVTKVGRALTIHHAQSIVINPSVVIGDNVTIRHGLTLGHGRVTTEVPVIDDGVDLGAGVTIVGGVHIGRGARVGAGAVVVHDVPDGAVVVGPVAQER